MHVARDQLESRIRIARPRLVDDADPGADIEPACVRVGAFGVDDVVIGPPGEPLRLIRHATAMRAGSLGRDVPYQRRACDQSARQRGQANARVVRKNLHRAVIAPQDNAALRRQQRSVERFGALATNLIDRDLPIDILLQQLVGADQIELIVLFQHRGAFRIGHRLECHRGRVDQRGHVGKPHGVAAFGQIEITLLPNHRITGNCATSGRSIGIRRDRARRRVAIDSQRSGRRGRLTGDVGAAG